jgi:hypothetical protein
VIVQNKEAGQRGLNACAKYMKVYDDCMAKQPKKVLAPVSQFVHHSGLTQTLLQELFRVPAEYRE